MKFNIAIRLQDYYLRLRFGRIIKVMGINSNLKDGNHILMWEFDITDEKSVLKALRLVQREYNLSLIHI